MNKNILLVDDDYDVISGYQRNLRKDFKIKIASSAYEALDVIKESPQFAVVISDYAMPKMNGIELLQMVRKVSPETVRIIITGYANLETAIEAVNQGNIFRFLTKPVSPDDLKKVLNDSCEQFRLVTTEKELLDKTLKGSIKILIDILSAANQTAFSQATRLRNLSRSIAIRMGLNKLWEVEIAALLSQIGCIALPEELLEKKFKGKQLTDSEQKLFSNHPSFARDLLKNIPRLESISEAISKQMISFDKVETKSKNVEESDLPTISRILKVVTDFDTLMQTGKSSSMAFKQMLQNEQKYDHRVLEALEKEITGTVQKRAVVKAIPFRDLRVNMILADDIIDDKGNVLLVKGTDVTDINLMRLISSSKVRKIVEPIKIWVKE